MAALQDSSFLATILYLFLDLIPHKLAVIGSGLFLNYHWYTTQNPHRAELYLDIWTLLKHDMSKFHFDELIPYSNHFRGRNKKDQAVTDKFRVAVNLHYSRNTHHGQFYEANEFRMPLNDLVELLCDSFAANWSYNREWPKKGEWEHIKRKWDKMKLHPANKVILGAMLSDLGYDQEVGGIYNDQNKAKEMLSNEEYLVYTHLFNKYYATCSVS